MIKKFRQRKKYMINDEQSVWDYIHSFQKPDEVFIQLRNNNVINLKKVLIVMKSLIDECPEKFRDGMAKRLNIPKYNGNYYDYIE